MKPHLPLSTVTLLILLLAGCSDPPPPPASPTFDPRIIESEEHTLRLTRIAGGLEHPWSVAFLPDGRYLVTERAGRLNLVTADGAVNRIRGVPRVLARNQGGLMEVSVHPDFSDNGWVYLTYSRGNWRRNKDWLALARGRLDGNRLVGVKEIFRQDLPHWPGRHYGARIAWLPDGTFLLSVGDRGGRSDLAQDPAHHFGSLVHLDENGDPAQDKPRFSDPGARPEIFSIGHRNIQGLVVDAANNRIWATEHGPLGGDELNLIGPGLNYGWPVVSLGGDYDTGEPIGEARSMAGMEDPAYEFPPTLAPSGLALVDSDRFPQWRGNLLAGGLRGMEIARLVIEDGRVVHDERLLSGEIGRVRDVHQGPDGYIYVLNDQPDGGLYRLEPMDAGEAN
jgi:glucose/arabinose dehydrogenase